MTAKIVASSNVFEKLFRLAANLVDYQKYVDVRLLYTAFVETVLACASSCFLPMDAHMNDDNDDDTPSEQKRVKQQ